MSNPFEAFQPEPPPAANGGKPQRKKRAKRQVAPPAAPTITAKRSPGRPRKDAAPAMPDTLRYGNKRSAGKHPALAAPYGKAAEDLRVPMSAMVGITADEMTVLQKVTAAVQSLPKKSRSKVVAAMGRIFA